MADRRELAQGGDADVREGGRKMENGKISTGVYDSGRGLAI